MDKLEKYIRDHREELDDQMPSAGVWQGIDRQLDQKGRQVFLRRHFWKAAAVVLLAAVIGLLIDRQQESGQYSLSQIETTEGIAFEEVEDYYVRMIENKQVQIRTYMADHPEFDQPLIQDIEKLDSSYVELKKTLVKRPDERVIDAMVVNLQTRIQILNEQLNILERIKQLKDQKDETNI